jgi:hypothetical protein
MTRSASPQRSAFLGGEVAVNIALAVLKARALAAQLPVALILKMPLALSFASSNLQ